MAKNDDKEKQKNNSPSLVDQLNIFRRSTKLATQEVLGVDEKYYDDNDTEITSIKNTISKVGKNFRKNTGDDIMDFYNATEMSNKPKKEQRVKKAQKQLMDVTRMIENPEMFNINEIFAQETGRFQLYSSYNMIYENIPQMTQALTTYVDNILSPDDFTKDVFNIFINDVSIDTIGSTTTRDSDESEIIQNCKKLIEDYKLETMANKILTESLKLGDTFVATLNMDKELEKVMLSEGFNEHQIDDSNTVNSNDIILTEDEVIQLEYLLENKELEIREKPKALNITSGKLNEDYKEAMDLYNESVKEFNTAKNKIQHDIAELINNNVIYTENSGCLLEDILHTNNDFGVTSKPELFNNYSGDSTTGLNQKKSNRGRKKKDLDIHVGGTVLKILKPERTIKLSLENNDYGYYYVENLENNPDFLTTGSYSMNSNLFTSFKSQETDQPDLVNAKYKLITDVFVRNLSKKIDKKFINHHPEFKNLIYNLLQQNYILNKQVRIVYLQPKEVVHFGLGINEYHDSIYKQILFSAKLYLAVLTSQVMLRLVRSPEKRRYVRFNIEIYCLNFLNCWKPLKLS